MTDGDLFGIHQTTVQRIVHRVSRLIASLSETYIRFPTAEKQCVHRIQFFDIAGFPGTIGLIDGTHIKIEKPTTPNAELYHNRKVYFSINVQLMMTSDFQIADIVSRWYGSAHDSCILANFLLYNKLENLPNGSWLLGDSGYPCLNFLLTPFLCLSNGSEERYNAAHIKTRNLIERGIGLWKRRFPVLKYGLHVKLQNCPPIIIACAVLHNISILLKEEHLEVAQNEEIAANPVDVALGAQALGNAVRRTVVENYFG